MLGKCHDNVIVAWITILTPASKYPGRQGFIKRRLVCTVAIVVCRVFVPIAVSCVVAAHHSRRRNEWGTVRGDSSGCEPAYLNLVAGG